MGVAQLFGCHPRGQVELLIFNRVLRDAELSHATGTVKKNIIIKEEKKKKKR